eukprot:5323267-Pleurochrysis_carterae.AAC.1
MCEQTYLGVIRRVRVRAGARLFERADVGCQANDLRVPPLHGAPCLDGQPVDRQRERRAGGRGGGGRCGRSGCGGGSRGGRRRGDG